MAEDRMFPRKPKRAYPLPERLRDLDHPYGGVWVCEIRASRVDRFKDGYDIGEDPNREDNRNSTGSILSKM